MTAAARLNRSFQQDGLLTARVVLQHDELYSLSLEVDRSELCARRAASCLLQPRPGDRVLAALTPEPYVLAVLERDAEQPAQISFDGDATLRARGKLEIVSGTLSVKSRLAQLVFEDVESIAARARAHFDESTLIARTVDRVAERIAEKAARVYRFVSEYDQLRARHFDYRAEHSAQIKGETTVITARQVAKIDGEQVHIG